MMVIGDKEMEGSTVNIRKYGEKKTSTLSEQEMIQLFTQLNEEAIPKELR